MSDKLTKAQLAGLAYIAETVVHGPAPGWNASVWIENVCEGDDLAVLFREGLIVAEPKAPPHSEHFDEDAGSITCDHKYRITEAGRIALSGTKQ